MSNANELELEMLDLVNAERANAGLDPLTLNTALNASAEDHSQWMLEDNTFSHTGQGGSSAGDRMREAGFSFDGNWQWAENIGWQSERGDEGFSDDVAMIHDGLMNSPGHRANILDPNLEEIGIGVEIGEFTSGGMDWEAVMITQNFATTDSDTSSQTDPGTGAPVEPEVEEPIVPVFEDPEPEDPVTDAPVQDGPDMEDPIAEDPVADVPEEEEPAVEEPVADAPETEDPEPEDPIAEGPDTDDPEMEEPVAEGPDTDGPVMEEPVAEGPDTDDPVADDPVTEEPVAEGPGEDMPDDAEEDLPGAGEDPMEDCCEALFAWLDNFEFALQSPGSGMFLVMDLGDVFADLWSWDDAETTMDDPIADGDMEVAEDADMNSWWFDCA